MVGIQTVLVGDGVVVRNLVETIEKIAQVDSTALITGESGTGKELVARMIHEKSRRSAGPLVTVNCGAIPAELLEAELFGHMKGAFTGATQTRQGRFAMAQGGTIFLDEVGDLPLALQVKLLRVLQTRQFEAVGSSQTVHLDVRIIAATNVDLDVAVREKRFREDLYYRLNVVPIRIPALRERREDIPVLVQHFIERANRFTGHLVTAPTGTAMEALQKFDWPGNIRELENLVERIVILKASGAIEMEDLPQQVFRKFVENSPMGTGAVSSDSEFPRMMLPKVGVDLKGIVAAFENHLIDQALTRTGGNKNRASELLRMNRTTLVEKLRKRGMIVPAGKNRNGQEDDEFLQNE